MPRSDLLALTEDDLTSLTNRGTVKRALRELDEKTVTCELAESPGGDLRVTWSDGIICKIPAGASLREAECSSGTTGISRHLVRSVFAYQRWQPSTSAAAAEPAQWDPGAAITDEMLAALFRKADLTRARKRFAAGVLVELVRGPKPLARFLDEPCTLRFMVPGDARYVHADCSPKSLSTFVPLAVWAFRELPADRDAGLVSIQLQAPPVPHDLLDDIEQTLLQLAEGGIANVGPVWTHKLTRLAEQCRKEGLIWPAEIISDLATEHERYHQHDALFSIDRVVDLVGELLIRADAIRSDRGELPQLLVRGTRSDRMSEIVAARFVGLGCGVRTTRKTTELTAYLQDLDTGNVVAVQREFASPADEDSSKDFAALAQTPILRGISLAGIAGGQLLIKSGKRSPSCRLTLPRSGASLNPQAFVWEKLRPPVLVESFRELTSLLAILPPRALRPRRVTEDLFVCAVKRATDARFDAAQQAVIATLHDAHGGTATLLHPYASRAAAGTEALLSQLEQGETLRFVSGHARPTASGLVIQPLCAVFEHEAQRTAVQPWIEDRPASASAGTARASATLESTGLGSVLLNWQVAIAELWLSGAARATPALAGLWQEASQQLESAGLLRCAAAAHCLATQLAQKSANPRWDWRPAGTQLLQLSVLAKLSLEAT